MSSFNLVVFQGNIGQDPELRYLPDGTPVCNFHMAVNENHTTAEGERKQETLWLNVVVFRKLAELCNSYLSKGKRVLVEGKLRQRSWEDQAGIKRYRVEVVASTCVFLDRATVTEAETALGSEKQAVENLGDGDVPPAPDLSP